MHIAFWSPAWPLQKFQNGIITYVHWMKIALEGQGHRVSVFTGTLDESIKDSRVFHIPSVRPTLWRRVARRLGSRATADVFEFPPAIAAGILEVHRSDPIDIIEMEESFGWFAKVGRLTSLPVVVKLHGPAFLSLVGEELESSFAREKIRREGEALREAPTIISPSQSTLTQTMQRYGLSPRVAKHIANPLVLDENTPLWRHELCDPSSILFVGRFDLRKGADVILKAFRLLLESRPKLKLIFAGPDSGLPAPGGQLIHFDAYRDDLFSPSQRKHVDFRGRLTNGEIAVLRTQAMTTVIASRWENQGYTLLEAMAQGCPVVSSDAGGCPESVSHGRSGLLAKSEEPEDFAKKLCEVLDDPGRAARMGQAARAHVSEHHSPDHLATLSCRVYDQAIALHRG